jgi:hypothetical protein
VPLLKSYSHDVFVSYAHGPAPLKTFGGDRRDPLTEWTQRLVDDLRGQIDIYLGTKNPEDRIDIWMDPDLEGNQALSEALKQKAGESALLLIFMSDFYLTSSWCGQEVGWFAESLSKLGGETGRIFVVRAFRTDESKWPDILRPDGNALPGYQFHPPADPDEFTDPYGWPRPTDLDKEYWNEVARLAQQITKQVKRLKWVEDNKRSRNEGGDTPPKIGKVAGPGAAPHFVGRRVLLGYMHDTLEDVREIIRTNLEEAGLTVLPPRTEEAWDEESLQRVLEAYLGQSEAVVLVANEYPGKWPKGQVGGFVGYQLQKAGERHVPTFLWLKLDKEIKANDYKLYIDTILQRGARSDNIVLRHKDVTEFLQYLKINLNKPTPPSSNVERLALVYYGPSQEEKISETYKDLVKGALRTARRIPNSFGPDVKDGQIRLQALEKAISSDKTDTVVVVCFDQDWDWASEVLSQLNQISARFGSRQRKLFIICPRDLDRGSLEVDVLGFKAINALDPTTVPITDHLAAELLEEAVRR